MGHGSGDIFGTYHLLDEIGRGGAGDVYRARHIHPAYAEKIFAIKRLHQKLADDPAVISRFRREAYVLSMLEHPNLVKTIEAGLEGDELFIAMEYVDGHDLGALLDRMADRRMPTALAVYLCSEILAGLGYGHVLRDSGNNPLNIVHRDVKPSNVLVGYDGRVKLTDFGVATLTGARSLDPEGTVMGTMGYIAPEALSGRSFDHRVDIFAVGAILFELLCGINPFNAESSSRIIKKNARAQVPRPTRLNATVPKGLEQVVLKALERDPNARFADAREMLLALMPYAPKRAGMALALGSLVRDVFTDDYARVQQQRDSHVKLDSSSRILVFAERYGKDLSQLMRSLRITAEPYTSILAFSRAVQQNPPPTAILVDVAHPAFNLHEFTSVLTEARRVVPVVGLVERFDHRCVQTADAVGAIDLLTMPVGAIRLLTSLRAGLVADPRATSQVPSGDEHEGQGDVGLRVRVITADPDLGARLSSRLREWGYAVDVSSTCEEALHCTGQASPHGIVYDYGADPNPDPRFAERIRSCSGMGLVPVIYLTTEGRDPGPVPERCTSRPRSDSDMSIISTFNQLRMTAHLGRTFTRYHSHLEAELRYGGRSFPAISVDVSRGGVLLASDHIPSVGTSVRVVLKLHGREIEMPGQVVRVELGDGDAETQQTRIGIAFRPTVPRDEEPLIRYISAIGQFR